MCNFLHHTTPLLLSHHQANWFCPLCRTLTHSPGVSKWDELVLAMIMESKWAYDTAYLIFFCSVMLLHSSFHQKSHSIQLQLFFFFCWCEKIPCQKNKLKGDDEEKTKVKKRKCEDEGEKNLWILNTFHATPYHFFLPIVSHLQSKRWMDCWMDGMDESFFCVFHVMLCNVMCVVGVGQVVHRIIL